MEEGKRVSKSVYLSISNPRLGVAFIILVKFAQSRLPRTYGLRHNACLAATYISLSSQFQTTGTKVSENRSAFSQ
jgi:hypothetical protein